MIYTELYDSIKIHRELYAISESLSTHTHTYVCARTFKQREKKLVPVKYHKQNWPHPYMHASSDLSWIKQNTPRWSVTIISKCGKRFYNFLNNFLEQSS